MGNLPQARNVRSSNAESDDLVKPVPPKPSKYDGRQVSLQFQIASDLHIEFQLGKGNDPDQAAVEQVFSMLLQPSAPYLALLGDIGLPTCEGTGQYYRQLLAWCATRWQEVWVVAGNHEFYKSTDQQTHKAISEACAAAGSNVYYMHKTAFDRHGVRVCGTCLWSAIPDQDTEPEKYQKLWYQLSDYRRIKIVDGDDVRDLEPTDSHQWHIDQLAWLTEEINQAKLQDKPVVVLSHHAPSLLCSEPDIPPSEPASAAFCSHLDYLFNDPVVLWAYGHTHFPFDQRYGTTRVISNPAGYPHEHPTPYGKP